VESIREATVARKPGHRGERDISRKAIAQGMPVETGEPVEDYRILCGHGCIGHPAFPAPSIFFRANEFLGNSGASRRGIMKVCLPSLRAKRSNLSRHGKQVWIASSLALLAMTLSEPALARHLRRLPLSHRPSDPTI
jgi:hypothetical protein